MNYAIQVLSEELHRIRSYQRTLQTREEGAVKGDLAHLARYAVQIKDLERGILFINGCAEANADLNRFFDTMNITEPTQPTP